MKPMRIPLLLIAAVSAFAADAKLTPEMQAVVNHVSSDSLRGHLSFLASDLLEGRATPSLGLDLAAEYIAAQFRRAHLEPAGDDQYFQTAMVTVREQNPSRFEMTVTAGDRIVRVDPGQTSILPDKPIQLVNVPIIAVDGEISAELASGKVILLAGRERPPAIPSSAVLVLTQSQGVRPVVLDSEAPGRQGVLNIVASSELVELLRNARDARVTLHVEPSIERTAKVRNVAGILRGSDSALRDTYVMVTAHYDHLGMRATGEDKIFNGANDDGSGTVSVIEIASALAALDPHPKRSILFVTFFGEEIGLVGSRYYGRHPLEPLVNTIADLNLEQVGRTDDSEGPQVGTATVTGFDFSGLTDVLINAGALTGVKVYKNEQNSDPYFAFSDNQPLADAGVPAHTLGIAFDFPDYHGVGDEWPKIDYQNMAKVDRMVAVGVLHLASEAAPPKWNDSNPAVKKYVDAAKKLKQ